MPLPNTKSQEFDDPLLVEDDFIRNQVAQLEEWMRFLKSVSLTAATIASSVTAGAESRPADIVDVKSVDDSILVNMMYNTDENFVGAKIEGYRANICFLTRQAAQALKNAQSRLKKRAEEKNTKMVLLARDCYRPRKAVQHFVRWANDPSATEKKETYYPELPKDRLIKDGYIASVSGHSRASTVDITIAELQDDGNYKEVDMGTIVDYFGEKSHTDSRAITKDQAASRKLLKSVLAPEFKNYSKEWWHYSLAQEPYPNTGFDFDVVP